MKLISWVLLHEYFQVLVSIGTLVALGGGVCPIVGHTGSLRLQNGAFFKLAVYLRVGKIIILVYKRVTKSTNAKCIKVCQILAELTMLNTYKLGALEQLSRED